MTIHLPKDVESSIAAAVQGGLFASADEAVAEAWRHLQRQQVPTQTPATADHDPILGLFHDDAELMDAIVAQAYQDRATDTGRELSVE